MCEHMTGPFAFRRGAHTRVRSPRSLRRHTARSRIVDGCVHHQCHSMNGSSHRSSRLVHHHHHRSRHHAPPRVHRRASSPPRSPSQIAGDDHRNGAPSPSFRTSTIATRSSHKRSSHARTTALRVHVAADNRCLAALSLQGVAGRRPHAAIDVQCMCVVHRARGELAMELPRGAPHAMPQHLVHARSPASRTAPRRNLVAATTRWDSPHA